MGGVEDSAEVGVENEGFILEMSHQKIRNRKNAPRVWSHGVVLDENRVIGRGDEVVPEYVWLGEGVRGRVEPNIEGDGIANLALFDLAVNAETNRGGKVADWGLSGAAKCGFNNAAGRAAIIVDNIAVITTLLGCHVDGISAFGAAFIGGGVVVVSHCVVTGSADVNIGGWAVYAAHYVADQAGLGVGVVVACLTDPAVGQILAENAIAKSAEGADGAVQEVVLSNIALDAVEEGAVVGQGPRGSIVVGAVDAAGTSKVARFAWAICLEISWKTHAFVALQFIE